MLIKVMGSLLLTAAGAIASLSLCRYHRKRLQALDGFISLIYYIKGQVDCYARPLSDILASLPCEIAVACNCPKGVSTLGELIDGVRNYLDEEGLRLCRTFAAEFGAGFREEQVRRCDHYIALLNMRREQIERRVSAESRAGSAICVCLSLCLLILLW